jgi:hypothetical protein
MRDTQAETRSTFSRQLSLECAGFVNCEISFAEVDRVSRHTVGKAGLPFFRI